MKKPVGVWLHLRREHSIFTEKPNAEKVAADSHLDFFNGLLNPRSLQGFAESNGQPHRFGQAAEIFAPRNFDRAQAFGMIG